MEKLEPCPFCGCEKILIHDLSDTYWLSCSGCKASATKIDDWPSDERESCAIDSWNCRYLEDKLRAYNKKLSMMVAGFREYFTAIEDGEYPKSRPILRDYEKVLLDKSRDLKKLEGTEC